MNYGRLGILKLLLPLSLAIAAAGCAADSSPPDEGDDGVATLSETADADDLGTPVDADARSTWRWGFAKRPGRGGWGWAWVPDRRFHSGGDWVWAWVERPGWGWVYRGWRFSDFPRGYRGGFGRPPGLGFAVPLPYAGPPSGPPYRGHGSFEHPRGQPPRGVPPHMPGPGGHRR